MKPADLPRLADRWVRQGHINEAFALLFEGTQMREDMRAAPLERYLRMCHWLAADGHLLEADQRLQRLADSKKTESVGLEQQIQHFVEYANLASQNIEKYLSSPKQTVTAPMHADRYAILLILQRMIRDWTNCT